jgi:Rrf2 family protein
MSQIFKISEAASIAIHALIILGSEEDKAFTTTYIAEKLNVSKDHCAKVMQRLTKVHFVSAKRGPKGGFYLTIDADLLSVLEIYEAIDGPLVTTSCFFKGSRPCDNSCCQLFGDLLNEVNRLAYTNFKETKLIELIKRNGS